MKLNKDAKVKGQIKDRGRIKWTAMMLPEHIEMLREWKNEDRYSRKPDLDEFSLEAIHEEIRLSQMRQCDIEIQLWRNGPDSLDGKVSRTDLQAKLLYLNTVDGTEKIPFEEIIGAKIFE